MAVREFIESREEMERVLHEENVGYLGLSVDGQPYVVPLSYAYVDGRILFHCALTGRKLDAIRANPHVCFTVGHQTGQVQRHRTSDPCYVESDSVICTGVARIVEDVQERQRVLDSFNHFFLPDAGPISLEEAAGCCAVEIVLSKMTGRQERDGKRTYFKHHFPST